MKVQDYLRKRGKNKLASLNSLKDQLGIKYTLHPEDSRVILNYNQIESPKTNEIVRECRGLVLDTNDWSLVARSFSRFFNLGEVAADDNNFDWSCFYSDDKEDGSLLLVYHWQGNWHINTRGSFGQATVGDFPLTWHDLSKLALPDDYERKFNPEFIYVGELCSRYNKIVRDYDEPTFFLLTAFQQEKEVSAELADVLAKEARLPRPFRYYFDSVGDVQVHIRKVSKIDPTYEGLVLRDGQNNRIKVKSAEYVALHRIASNGNVTSWKNLLPFIISGETDELLCYFPEVEPKLNEVKDFLDQLYLEVDNLWFCYHDEKSQKKFALAVKDHCCSGILFEARKRGVHPKELWTKDYLEGLLKRLNYE